MSQLHSELKIKDTVKLHANLDNSWYINETVKKGLGRLSRDGALLVTTGKHTGRSANDRYIVKNAASSDTIWWENNLRPMSDANFNKVKNFVLNYLNSQKELYLTDRSVGALKESNIGARVLSTHPQHVLFANHLFREPMHAFNNKKDFLILHAPELKLDAKEFETRSETAVITCFETNTTIIVGTLYAGEIKKSMFAAMNFRLPPTGVLPMHAGASRLSNGASSVFFGLSGTGKTTLSCDEGTLLIGDDEHGLSDDGIFNFEGGCYAKTYKLSNETEPGIFSATNRFGAMIENVTFDETTGEIDFNSMTITENGRSSYPLTFIDELEPTAQGKIPEHIFFLTADAFGVLPPVSKLTKEQAMFYFVLGYTAKLAGTEMGIKEPQAAFSPCFGAPFMLRRPSVYAELLGQYLSKHNVNVWLINTGWTGGAYGEGERFPLKVTRKIIRAVQANTLNQIPTESDPYFGLHIPLKIEGVDANMLMPQKTWKDQKAYTKKAQELATSFHTQMQKFGDFYSLNAKGAPSFNANK